MTTRKILSLPLASLFALALLGTASCGTTEKQVKLNRWGKPIPEHPQPPPKWIANPPKSSHAAMFAMGYSGPTFWPQDAINNASEDARGKLALSLSSNAESYRQEVQTSGGHASALDLTKEATDLVMQNSRIESQWVDEAGQLGEAGGVYALASITLSGDRKERAIDGPDKNNKMPGWLDRLPSSTGKLYAAGYSGPTFRPDDAMQYAGDQAVTNLASALRSRVQAYELLVQTQTGMSVDDFSHTANPDQEFLELVKKNARIEQVWVDEDGNRPGDPPGAVWALAGIEVQSGKGGYQRVDNEATGPALDPHGNAGPEPKKAAQTAPAQGPGQGQPGPAQKAPAQQTPTQQAPVQNQAQAPAPTGAAPSQAPAPK